MTPDGDLFGRPIAGRPAPVRQLPLPLAWQGGRGDDDAFLIGDANREAVAHLQSTAHWPVPVSVLVGPPRSGRSTLAQRFAASTGGIVIDPAQGADEERLFHAYNSALSDQRPLLLVADAAPGDWRVSLPDLATRLAAAPVVRIAAPDAQLAPQLVEQWLARRGVMLAPATAAFVADRIERSYVALERAVAAIDAHVLAQRSAASLPQVRAALRDAEMLA